MSDPVTVMCPECKSSAGDPCRDRYARAKPTCAARGNAAVMAQAKTQPVPAGTPASEPLLIDCPRCRAKAGEKCRDYRGKGKATCGERVNPPAAVEPPKPVAAPPSLDFTEDTPPPRTRPQGESIPAYCVLQPGEDVEALFREWDRAGRIPAGSVLVCRDARCGAVGLRACGAGVEPPPRDLVRWARVIDVVALPLRMPAWAVMAPMGARKAGGA